MATVSTEMLRRIEQQLNRLEGRDVNNESSNHREAWLVAGFRPHPVNGEVWYHEDGRVASYAQVLTSLPEVSDVKYGGGKVQEGYLIRKVLKEEHRPQGEPPFVDRGPDYLHPGESYQGFKGYPPVPSVRIGWYTRADAQDALNSAEYRARMDGYGDAFDKFDHVIVKVTVIEEEQNG